MNGDSQINVSDIVFTVNIILGLSEYNMQVDLNGDGTVNVVDVVQLVNKILS